MADIEVSPTQQADIASVAALEAVIGKTPPAVNLKVIDHLDPTALHWITQSPLLFAGFGGADTLAISLAGGLPGFAGGDRTRLLLPLAALDDPALAVPGIPFSALLLAPGIGETLRINGHVAEIDAGMAVIAVEECFVHCAKALIRSGFWTAAPIDALPQEAPAFIAASRFMALATLDAANRADLSPKGDPAGSMAMLDDGRLIYADRPGNRRADSFRNILAQPRIAAALLVPGTDDVAIVSGTARLTTDPTVRERFAVQGKAPLLATIVDDLSIIVRPSAALARAPLWPAGRADGIRPAKMFAAHVKLNSGKGLGAKLAGAALSIPGMMEKALEKDYKTNLY